MHGENGEIDGIQKVQYELHQSELFETYILCCAANDLGRECTSLFTIGNFPFSVFVCESWILLLELVALLAWINFLD